MAAVQTEAKKSEILAEVRGELREGEVGPIKTLVELIDFERIVLLTNFKSDWSARYVKWLGQKAEVVQTKIKNPTDYETIFRAAEEELSKVRKAGLLKTHELCIHLSPGSPAMTAVWLLLGKSKYPATFYQTYNGRAWVTDVPFDLSVDFLPDLFADPDKHLQQLAAKSPSETAGFESIIGESREIRLAVGRAKKAAIRGVSVLLLGESGVGKEMFAQAIHQASPRAKGPFVAINCAAISRELLESELFGHKKGAFTGADKDRRGAFAEADKGTLFLDEIGECDLELQAKLLRVLQPPEMGTPCQRVFRSVGATKDESSDVRVIAATNKDLVKLISDGRFREDLYYRLAVITVNLPPLRERNSDIRAISEALLDRINRQLSSEGEPGYNHKSLSGSAISFVKQKPWPGNVRQLYNVLLQAAVMSDADVLNKVDLEAALGEMPQLPGNRLDSLEYPLGDGFDLEKHLNDIQRHYLRRAMEAARGVKAEASRLLGIAKYQTLDAQLKRLGVNDDWSDSPT
jgi:transcriptional regulator with PAS, ATPase and Fis domain